MFDRFICSEQAENQGVSSAKEFLHPGESLQYSAHGEVWSGSSGVFALWLVQYSMPWFYVAKAFGLTSSGFPCANSRTVIQASSVLRGALTIAVTSQRLLLVRNGKLEGQLELADIRAILLKENWNSKSLIIKVRPQRSAGYSLRLWAENPRELAGAVQQSCATGGAQ